MSVREFFIGSTIVLRWLLEIKNAVLAFHSKTFIMKSMM